jgi:hypothetical protein
VVDEALVFIGQVEGFAAGAVGLQAAELVDGTVEEGVGSGSGAFDGAAGFVGFVVE